MKIGLESSSNTEFILALTTLFQTSTRYSIQQRGDWIPAFLKYFLNGKNFYFLSVRDEKELVSCLCLQKKAKRFYKLFTYTFLIDLGNGVNDFFYIPCKAGYEQEVSAMYASWFKENPSFWENLRLQFLPKTEMHTCFIEAMQKHHLVNVSEERSYFKIDTSRAWEDYFTAEMNKRLRDVRGRTNRIEKSGHVVESKVIETGIDAYLEDFLIHFSKRRESKNEKNSYEDDAKVKLIRDVIAAGERDHSVQLSILEDQKGAIWAYQLDLMDRNQGIWYHYAPTFNDAYQEFSPSKILLFASLKRAFADPQIKEFNFMRGEAEYKKQFTDDSERYLAIDITNSFSKKIKFQKLMASVFSRVKG